jgi:hypothetical protein
MPVQILSAMAATEALPRAPFVNDHLSPTAMPKPIPILTTPNDSSAPLSPPDPMEITPTSASMPPPASSSPPSADRQSERKSSGEAEGLAPPTMNGNMNESSTNGIAQPLGAAAAASQPTKVVQTAFIHKLYK